MSLAFQIQVPFENTIKFGGRGWRGRGGSWEDLWAENSLFGLVAVRRNVVSSTFIGFSHFLDSGEEEGLIGK